jgi:HK97 family phage major capsid protein/HK97 family phage prohead protease
MLHRVAEFDRAAINADDRTVEIAFSSEMPVERYFGNEILDHESSSVRLGRLNNGGAVLVEHDRRDQVGVVVKASIDGDRVGRATIRFGKSPRAQEIFQDVKDGIRRLVSVGYRIHRQETTNQSGGLESVRVTDWEPYELSLVSIPADDSVGVGRSDETSVPQEKSQTEINSMSQENTSAAAPEAAATRSAETPAVTVIREAAPVDHTDAVRSAMTAERSRIAAISAIAEQARSQGVEIDASRAISDGLNPEAVRQQAFDALVSRQKNFTPGTPSRMEARDISRFDLGAALRSMVNDKPLSGIEREMIQEGEREAAASGLGLGRGITLPSFLVRDMTATGGSSGNQGGNTIATQKVGLLDDFFNASIMRQLGATVLTGLTQNVDLPRLIAGTAAAKKTENAAADEVSPTTGVLSLSPKRLPAFIDLSQQLLLQSSSAIEQMIRMHLTNQLLATQEASFFHGGGTSEATGIAATVGIGSVAGGTNGAAPTFAHMLSLESAVDTTNALGGSLCYATNGQIKAKLKSTPKQSSGVEGNFVINDMAPNVINGYRAEFSNAISRTLTKGSTTGVDVCSAIFFGNFADYVIGYWGGLQLELLRDSNNAKSGLYTLVANTYYDGGVVRPKSFAAMLDALGA